MKTETTHESGRGPWYRVAVLTFAVTVLLACKFAEEVKLNKDGSGTYRGELLLVGDEKQMLRAVKEELADRPELEILGEGPRGDDYFIVFGMLFTAVGELNEDSSVYTWTLSEEGASKKKARLEVANRGIDQESFDEHRLEITMPGRVIDTNAEKVSGNKVVWDRLAAGRNAEIFVEAEVSESPRAIVVAGLALTALVAAVLMTALWTRRRGR